MSSEDETARAIAAYREQLSNADLAASDIDEIEDHLRALTAELRERGMPAAQAVTAAAARLGEPSALAREHARVRTAFGTRLSRARTFSAALLIAPMVVLGIVQTAQHAGVWTHFMLECVFGVVLTAALVARLGWARPIVFGGCAFFAIPALVNAYVMPDPYGAPLYVVWHLAILAFVAPWSRRELSPAGLALAFQVWSYGAAAFALSFQVTTDDGSLSPIAPAALIAFGMAVVATLGGILRARWSAFASALSALTLGIAAVELGGLSFEFPRADVMSVAILACTWSGVVAAAAGSVLAWRSARSMLGTLRTIVS